MFHLHLMGLRSRALSPDTMSMVTGTEIELR